MISKLDITASYTVRFRNQSEDIIVLAYDRDTRLIIPQGYDDLIYIERESDREAWVFMDNYVMFMDNTGLISVGELSSRPRPNNAPRLDFCRQYTDTPEVMASLHVDGRLYVPNAFELDLQLDGRLLLSDGDELDLGHGPTLNESRDDQMIFYDRIAFNRLGLYAVKIEETGLLDIGGAYLQVGGQGQMLQV